LTERVATINMLPVSSRIDPNGDWFPGPPFPQQTRAEGLAVGFVASLPAAFVVVAVFGLLEPRFAASIAFPALTAGAITGATFGRRIAADPTAVRVLLGPALAVLVGAPVGGVVASLLLGYADAIRSTVVGLVLYGIPAYVVLAVPTFVFGIYLDRSGRLAELVTALKHRLAPTRPGDIPGH
jgi:hypothetical protein